MQKTDKKFIITIIVVLVVMVTLIGLWFYVFFKIDKKAKDIYALRSEIEGVRSDIEEVKSAKKLLNNIKDERVSLDSIFFNENGLIDFLRELEFLAAGAGVSLELSSANIPNLKFKATGSFGDVFRFLSLLENMRYKIILNKTKISKERLEWSGDFDILLVSFVSNK